MWMMRVIYNGTTVQTRAMLKQSHDADSHMIHGIDEKLYLRAWH